MRMKLRIVLSSVAVIALFLCANAEGQKMRVVSAEDRAPGWKAVSEWHARQRANGTADSGGACAVEALSETEVKAFFSEMLLPSQESLREYKGLHYDGLDASDYPDCPKWPDHVYLKMLRSVAYDMSRPCHTDDERNQFWSGCLTNILSRPHTRAEIRFHSRSCQPEALAIVLRQLPSDDVKATIARINYVSDYIGALPLVSDAQEPELRESHRQRIQRILDEREAWEREHPVTNGLPVRMKTWYSGRVPPPPWILEKRAVDEQRCLFVDRVLRGVFRPVIDAIPDSAVRESLKTSMIQRARLSTEEVKRVFGE